MLPSTSGTIAGINAKASISTSSMLRHRLAFHFSFFVFILVSSITGQIFLLFLEIRSPLSFDY